MGFATTILHSQLFVTPPVPSYDFTGQTIIVTGATSGLGLEAVKHFVKLGASRVILAVRNVSKGREVVRELTTTLAVSANRLDVWKLDLGSFASVKEFGERVRTLDRLDALVQNAGIMTSQYQTVEGYESQIAVNVISPVLLGYLVLPKLQESAKTFGVKGRLAFVGSDLHFMAQIKEKSEPGSLLQSLTDEKKANMSDRYGVSKLLLLWAVKDMAQKFPVTGLSDVIITCITPGLCKSNIDRDDVNWLVAFVRGMALGLLARSTEVGGRTLVHGVATDLSEECHGAFLMDCAPCKDLTGNSNTPEMKEVRSKFLGELYVVLKDISPGVL